MAKDSRKASRKKTSAENSKQEFTEFYIVGIGASAGGLEALRPLVSNLHSDTPMAFVVVQHMAPQYRSMMVELLSRETALPVHEIKNRNKLVRGHIYITPPNQDVEVRNATLYLKPPSNPIGPKPSIDNFFSSLAEDQGEHAIGVILSGTGSDGTLGIRAVKAHGGFAVVQAPDTAKYNGMPRAAIETNLIDLILAPERIGSHLHEVIQAPTKILELMSDEQHGRTSLEELFTLVRRETDIDFSKYKEASLCRRIERRIHATGSSDLQRYLSYIRENPHEAESLVKDVLISVTSFFRDKDAFKVAENAIEEMLKHKNTGDEIRFWVCGCASGEEAYTMAIILAEQLGVKLGSYRVQVFATDIDSDALERARKGIFLETSLRDLEAPLLNRYFTKHGDKYHIAKELRDIVVFARQDLVKDPPFVRLDLISCRNVLIYLTQETQERIFNAFHFALNGDGYLFLGKSEAIGQNTNLFTITNNKFRLYRKRGGLNTYVNRPLTIEPHPSRSTPVTNTDLRRYSIEDTMRSAMVKHYAPKSMMVGEDGQVYQINGDITGYMILNSGKGDLNAAKQLIPELRGEYWALLARAKKEDCSVVGSIKPIQLGNERKGVRIGIHPSPSNSSNPSKLFLVGLEEFDLPETNESLVPDQLIRTDQLRLPELEQELIATKEHLQTVIEELETSNEELQALNEEMQASNEEMQSTNEELETSNEELQSTNEELTTVNEELQTRSSQLIAANADFENMQRNVGYSIVMVDTRLRIKRYTPSAVKYFGITESDIGDTITALPTHITFHDLKTKITKVIKQNKPHQEEVISDRHALWFKIVPYHSLNNQVDGAVLIIIDQTELYNMRIELAESECLLRLMFDNLPLRVAMINQNQQILTYNRAFSEWFSTDKTLKGKKLSTILGRKLYNTIKANITTALSGESIEVKAEARVDHHGLRHLRIMLTPRKNDDNQIDGILLTIDDATALNNARVELARLKSNNIKLIKNSNQGIFIHRNGKPLFANDRLANLLGYTSGHEAIQLGNIGQALGSVDISKPTKIKGRKKNGNEIEITLDSQTIDWNGQASIQSTVIEH